MGRWEDGPDDAVVVVDVGQEEELEDFLGIHVEVEGAHEVDEFVIVQETVLCSIGGWVGQSPSSCVDGWVFFHPLTLFMTCLARNGWVGLCSSSDLVHVMLGKAPVQPRHDFVVLAHALDQAVDLVLLLLLDGVGRGGLAAALDNQLGAVAQVARDARSDVCLGCGWDGWVDDCWVFGVFFGWRGRTKGARRGKRAYVPWGLAGEALARPLVVELGAAQAGPHGVSVWLRGVGCMWVEGGLE